MRQRGLLISALVVTLISLGGRPGAGLAVPYVPPVDFAGTVVLGADGVLAVPLTATAAVPVSIRVQMPGIQAPLFRGERHLVQGATTVHLRLTRTAAAHVRRSTKRILQLRIVDTSPTGSQATVDGRRPVTVCPSRPSPPRPSTTPGDHPCT